MTPFPKPSKKAKGVSGSHYKLTFTLSSAYLTSDLNVTSEVPLQVPLHLPHLLFLPPLS